MNVAKLATEEMYEQLTPERKTAVDAAIESTLLQQNSDNDKAIYAMGTQHTSANETEREFITLYQQLDPIDKTAVAATLFSTPAKKANMENLLSNFCYRHSLGQYIGAISRLNDEIEIPNDLSECTANAIRFLRKVINIKLAGYRANSYAARCRHGYKSRRLARVVQSKRR